jgi:hypothetical protein
MAKRKKNPLLEALNSGRSYTWTVPDGGNLASMRKAVKHGQTLTMSPIANINDIHVGDIVLVKWHQSNIFHIVGDIQKNQYLIVNSLGKENGWVEVKEILGKVTKTVEPEPRPDVPLLLEQLRESYLDLIDQGNITSENAQRLLSCIDDLQWYANRIGKERLDTMPRDNIWSFHQNLWRLTKQARNYVQQKEYEIHKIIDQGKQCVGQAGEIVSLFGEKELKPK